MKYDAFRRRAILAVPLFGLLAGAAIASGGTNPDAEEILKSMSTFLAGTKTFSVSADISNEVISQEGQKLQFNGHAALLIERPSHFRVTRKGRFSDAVLFYDGSQVTIHGKAINAYVQQKVVGTIDDAIHAIERQIGLDLPGADLLLSNPYKALTSGATSSGYYGIAYVDGIESHHLAFRTPTVDWQIWVKAGDEPLPMKYVITTKWLTGAPQYSEQFSEWNLKPDTDADQFTFVAPQGAENLEVLPTDMTGEIATMQENK